MKSKIGQFFLVAAVVLGAVSTSASAQTRSGQVFEDHTKVQKLTGTVESQKALECPSGTVYSGGACVLISNQSTRAGEVLALDGGVGFGSVRCPSGYAWFMEYGPDEVNQSFPRTVLCRKL